MVGESTASEVGTTVLTAARNISSLSADAVMLRNFVARGAALFCGDLRPRLVKKSPW
jgi:hypothetical protein